MISITGPTLFIVGSPFQCLCMLEAINHWQISDYDVIVNALKVNEPMISRLLCERGISYKLNRRNHLLKEVLPILFTKHKHYNNVFIGNYYNKAYQDMALAYCNTNANVIYLDDGTQALELFSESPRIVKEKAWVVMIQALFSFLALLKRIDRKTFFTIYDVKSDKFIIEKNKFKILKKENQYDYTDGVYIIGTNSSKIELKDCNYKDLLIKTISWCKKEYPEQDVFYCPHRGDSNNNELKPLLTAFDVKWFDTKVSVEYDFMNDGIYPKEVVGFNSNALFTLHSLFPQSIISNVVFQIKDEKANMENRIIRKRLSGYGIRTIND